MGSFTIHSLNSDLNTKLTLEARNKKTSKNNLIKTILAKSMGMESGNTYTDDYREFCGLWNSTEQALFETAQQSNKLIDPEDWN